jgi:hypothetical protein
MLRSVEASASSIFTGRPASRTIEVTPTPCRPQGWTNPNGVRSGSTFRASPWKLTVAAGRDTEVAAGADHDFFQPVHHVHDADSHPRQVHDGVDHQLARAVVGDVAAALDLEDRDPAACERFLGHEKTLASAALAEGEDRRVFEEQHGVPL